MLIDIAGLKEKRKEYKHGIKQIDRLLKFSHGIDLELNGSTPRKRTVVHRSGLAKRHMSAAARKKISIAMKARHREKKAMTK